ncbi:MAG: hypothetical protein KF715_16485 [Candidatus Didemnitutus sp.]|nr:hypothetical protein [Candidatus Didemnitutus sp.]
MQEPAATSAAPSPAPSPFDEEEVVAMSASHIVIHAPKGRYITIMCPVGFSPGSVEGIGLDKPLFARVRYLAC